jgi:hypothetical protein
VTDPIRPIGRPDPGTPPVPAVRRLTPKEREDAARERQRRRRGRHPAAASQTGPAPPAEGGGGSLDVRA